MATTSDIAPPAIAHLKAGEQTLEPRVCLLKRFQLAGAKPSIPLNLGSNW
jgi:hypothetical protein